MATHVCYSLVETEEPPPSATRSVDPADDTHGGCGVCALILTYLEDESTKEISVAVPEGASLPSGLQATVSLNAGGSERRYAPSPEAMDALKAEGQVCWALPPELPGLTSLVIDFRYQEGGATISHERLVRLRERASLAPAAE